MTTYNWYDKKCGHVVIHTFHLPQHRYHQTKHHTNFWQTDIINFSQHTADFNFRYELTYRYIILTTLFSSLYKNEICHTNLRFIENHNWGIGFEMRFWHTQRVTNLKEVEVKSESSDHEVAIQWQEFKSQNMQQMELNR